MNTVRPDPASLPPAIRAERQRWSPDCTGSAPRSDELLEAALNTWLAANPLTYAIFRCSDRGVGLGGALPRFVSAADCHAGDGFPRAMVRSPLPAGLRRWPPSPRSQLARFLFPDSFHFDWTGEQRSVTLETHLSGHAQYRHGASLVQYHRKQRQGPCSDGGSVFDVTQIQAPLLFDRWRRIPSSRSERRSWVRANK